MGPKNIKIDYINIICSRFFYSLDTVCDDWKLTHFLFIISVQSCDSLSEPQHGVIYPHMCKSFPVSGTLCEFECKPGYQDNGGVTEMHCGNDGEWNRTGSLLLCSGNFFSLIWIQLCRHYTAFFSELSKDLWTIILPKSFLPCYIHRSSHSSLEFRAP